MTRQLVVSKTDQQGRVVLEVREQNPLGEKPVVFLYGTTEDERKVEEKSNDYIQGVKLLLQWQQTEDLLKTFSVVQDGEVEVMAEERFPISMEDFGKEKIDSNAYFRSIWIEGFNANSQKYSLEQIFGLLKWWRLLRLKLVASKQEDEYPIGKEEEAIKFYFESQSPTYTVGQTVECEVDEVSEIAKIIK